MSRMSGLKFSKILLSNCISFQTFICTKHTQAEREGSIECKLHLYPKSYKSQILWVLDCDWLVANKLCPNILTNNFNLQMC